MTMLKDLLRPLVYGLRNRAALSRYAGAPIGSEYWLIEQELRFGGMVTNVPRQKVSPRDPRTSAQLQTGGMTGGDRMLRHGYARFYARYLQPFVDRGRPVVLAEFGILRGTGLATWCELFPGSRIMGFDIDLGHTRDNMDNLRRRGAFTTAVPELHEFDQFVDNTEMLGRILHGDRLDICIDDGYHSIETIMTTLRGALPFMADEFVYFVEDNRLVHREIAREFPTLTMEHEGMMTILTPAS